jgi:hypothetical protein
MAWAKKHGQHGHPHAHAPPHAHLVQNGFFAVPRPMDYGVRRDPFMDQYANHWPLMSNTMMHVSSSSYLG